jgi:hypothetical protein
MVRSITILSLATAALAVPVSLHHGVQLARNVQRDVVNALASVVAPVQAEAYAPVDVHVSSVSCRLF